MAKMLRVLAKEPYKNGAIGVEFVAEREYEVTAQQLQQIMADNPHAVISLPSKEFMEAQGIKEIKVGKEKK